MRCLVWAILLTVFALTCGVNAYEYSITIVEDYKHSSDLWPCNVGDLTPWGTREANLVEEWLGTKAGWSEVFRHKDSGVTKEDFGINNTGYQGLDEADFHFHMGHGYNLPVWGTFLALWDWSPCSGGTTVHPSDVSKKWDFNNEWVLLHSCNVLSDVSSWGNALKYSHIIMGFSTTTYADTNLIDRFFRAAIDWDWTITQSYYYATTETYDESVKAVLIADTEDQYDNDHLWGQGYVSDDEYPDDDTVWYAEWSC